MSFIKREDLPKALKLVGAIVAVFGCAAWRVAGATGSVTPKPTVAVTHAVLPPVSSEPSEEAVSEETLIKAPTMIASAAVDPFRPLKAEVSEKPTEESVVASASKALPVPSGQFVAQALPVLPSPLGAPPMTMTPPVVDVAVQAKPLKLTGIVGGPQATAVIEYGGEEYVVRIGTLLPDGSKVRQIGKVSLTLSLGERRTILSIDG